MIKERGLAKILPFPLELLFQGNQIAPKGERKFYFTQEMKELQKYHFTKSNECMMMGNTYLVQRFGK